MSERFGVDRMISVVSGAALTAGGLVAAGLSARYGLEAATMQPQMEMFTSLREAEQYIALATGAAGVAFAGAGVSIIQTAVGHE